MRSTRFRWVLAVSFVALTASTSAVQAGMWGDVAMGMSLVDYRFDGGPNLLGRGFDIETQAIYAGQQYNFGFADLVLGSPVAPTASNISMGYTTRGLPRAEFAWNTGGTALPYTLRINNGIQDITTDGSILIDVRTEVNVLGFYDTRVRISNRTESSTDGFLADESGNLDFDLGPIDISGNIYADALAAITQPLWLAAGTPNPFAKFSERATRTASVDATIEELRARVEAGEILSDDEMDMLINSTLLSAILGGVAGQGQLFSDFVSATEKAPTNTLRVTSVVPEPATGFLVMGLGTLLIARPRRRGR